MSDAGEQAKRIYEMALPIIDAAIAEAVAAERETCARLAEQHQAFCIVTKPDTLARYSVPFADLLRAQP